MGTERIPVARIRGDELSAARFRAHFERRAPLVVSAEPGYSDAPWRPEALREAFGARPVDVTCFDGARGQRGPRFESLARGVRSLPLGAFLDARDATTRDGEALYLRLTASHGAIPELFARVAFPELFTADGTGLDGWITHDTYLRVGPSSYEYPLHCDGMENLFVQLAGEKRFVLIDPAEVHRLSPHPDDPSRSLVNDVDAPDLTRFPDFADARLHECVVGPGDLLYLPALWFHEVRARGWSASASRYYKRPRRHTAYLRALKPPSWRAFESARGVVHY